MRLAPRCIATIEVRVECRLAAAVRRPGATRGIDRLAGFERQIQMRLITLKRELRQVPRTRRPGRSVRPRLFGMGRFGLGRRLDRTGDAAGHQTNRLGFRILRRRRPWRRAGGRPWRLGARGLGGLGCRTERRLGMCRRGCRLAGATTQRRQHQIGRRAQQLDDGIAPIRVADRRLTLGESALKDVGDCRDFVGTDRHRHDRQRARLQRRKTGARQEILKRRLGRFGGAGIHQGDALGGMQGEKPDPGRAIGTGGTTIREHDPRRRQRGKRHAQLRGDAPLGERRNSLMPGKPTEHDLLPYPFPATPTLYAALTLNMRAHCVLARAAACRNHGKILATAPLRAVVVADWLSLRQGPHHR